MRYQKEKQTIRNIDKQDPKEQAMTIAARWEEIGATILQENPSYLRTPIACAMVMRASSSRQYARDLWASWPDAPAGSAGPLRSVVMKLGVEALLAMPQTKASTPLRKVLARHIENPAALSPHRAKTVIAAWLNDEQDPQIKKNLVAALAARE